MLHLMLAVGAIGSAIGIAARDGLAVACVLVLFVSLSAVCFTRARKRWGSSSPIQRVYAVTTTVASFALLAGLIYSIGTNASLARARNARNFQSSLASEPRFSSVRVEYFEKKIAVLRVDGAVPTENDFQDLRQRLSEYGWSGIHGILWDVAVTESKHYYDGWDEDLFGDRNP